MDPVLSPEELLRRAGKGGTMAGLDAIRANSYVNRRSEEEIEAVLNWTAEVVDGRKVRGGRTFEEGVEAALSWAFGMSNVNPKEVP